MYVREVEGIGMSALELFWMVILHCGSVSRRDGRLNDDTGLGYGNERAES